MAAHVSLPRVLAFLRKTHAAENMGILPFPWRARRRAKIRNLRHLASSQPCPRQREPLITRAGGSKNIANMALPRPISRTAPSKRARAANAWPNFGFSPPLFGSLYLSGLCPVPRKIAHLKDCYPKYLFLYIKYNGFTLLVYTFRTRFSLFFSYYSLSLI